MIQRQAVSPRAMRDTFLESLYQAMLDDPEIFFVSADFGSPVLDKIRADRPDRFVNVGIAEQNLINVSAGLALEGFKVFAYAIAPFITMRCFEQIRVNLALLSEVRPMNVNLVGVGAGYSYVVSGPTHQCYEDISLMRSLPNMQIYSPADQITAAGLPQQCLKNNGAKYLRLDAQILPVIYQNEFESYDKGFYVHQVGLKVCMIATGYMLHTAKKAADELTKKGITPGIIDLFNISGFDSEQLESALSEYDVIVSMEEGFSGKGGMDAMLFDFIASRGIKTRLRNLGVKGGYRFEIGERDRLHELVGIGLNSVMTEVEALWVSLN